MPALKPLPNRWWYRPPWKVTDPWRHRVKLCLGGDEHCNDTILVVIPLLGDVTVRIRRDIRLHGTCEECVALFGPWCPGCEGPHLGPRCHRWIDCRHVVKLADCPACGGQYCHDCEPTPDTTCPAP